LREESRNFPFFTIRAFFRLFPFFFLQRIFCGINKEVF
jgi:hypothetical protein